MLTDVGLSPVVKGTWVAKVGALAFVAVVLSRMEAVSLTAFAVAKSGLPSPLKSPMLTERGPVSVEKGTWVAKVGVLAPVVVVLSRMEALSGLKFAVAKSSFMSSLKSPMLTEKGSVSVGKGTWVAKVRVVAPVVVKLSRMEALLLFKFATAKSRGPSLLKSPMLTEMGSVPVTKVTWVAKVGVVAPVVVVLSRMEALLLPLFATAKSGKPSPLKSPMLTDAGLVPVVKSALVAKPSTPL
jgi:hypothetical protein